jgi:hypothetical protein
MSIKSLDKHINNKPNLILNSRVCGHFYYERQSYAGQVSNAHVCPVVN